MISIALPVGPLPVHRRWLPECLESIAAQTVPPKEVILIDDMADLAHDPWFADWMVTGRAPFVVVVWRAPWRLGCAAGWNIGISLAQEPLVLMMGADDWLAPTCVEVLVETWRRHQNRLGYYFLTIEYHPEPGVAPPSNPIQDLPCNAAMVHRDLWRWTGGFPPEVGVGAPDAALISVLMANREAGALIPVGKGTPLYHVRVHADQDTAFRGPYQRSIIDVRNVLTLTWKPAEGWGRYRL